MKFISLLVTTTTKENKKLLPSFPPYPPLVDAACSETALCVLHHHLACSSFETDPSGGSPTSFSSCEKNPRQLQHETVCRSHSASAADASACRCESGSGALWTSVWTAAQARPIWR